MSKLLIIRDAAKKAAIDGELPAGWAVLAVGEKIYVTLGPYDAIICACEMYTQADWAWYHTVVKVLSKDNTKLPLWTN